MTFQDEVAEQYLSGMSFWDACKLVLEGHGIIVSIEELKETA